MRIFKKILKTLVTVLFICLYGLSAVAQTESEQRDGTTKKAQSKKSAKKDHKEDGAQKAPKDNGVKRGGKRHHPELEVDPD